MDTQRIASRENEHIKLARRLASSGAQRAKEGLFFAEGARLCFDLAGTLHPHTLFYTDAFLKANPKVATLGGEHFLINGPVDDKLSETKTPQGIYGLFPLPVSCLRNVDTAAGVLVCECMQDPSNVGAVLRSAAAFGMGGVVLLPGCADPASPRALRAGMGAIGRLPVVVGESLEGAMAFLQGHGVRAYAAALQGAAPLGKTPVQAPFALLVGNEGAGLTREALALADERVYIPMHHGTESLNAAVAASVLMFYFCGQM